MAGAAPRSTTSCASSTIFPAPRSSGWSATTAPPATSSPPPRLIAHNEGRLGKTLRTEDVDGEKVTVTGSWDSEEEARAIGEEIEELQRAGHKLNEIAILVRASFQMREFEERFVTLGLPYRVIGGPRFYERAEIRDALAYLRVINSPADDLAFERIVNVPKRGLGDATVQMLHDHARKRRHSAVRGGAPWSRPTS
jgi:DNA helicase-2/ATP-dependent DNA helicase PcrA